MTRVTDKDLGNFGYAGFDAPVSGAKAPSSDELFGSAARALEAPAARLMKAVYCVVVELAKRDDLDVGRVGRLSENARRRLGYVTERAAQSQDVGPTLRERLADFADSLHRREDPSKPSLTVIANATDSYVRILEQRGDSVNEKWRVYGDVEPLD